MSSTLNPWMANVSKPVNYMSEDYARGVREALESVRFHLQFSTPVHYQATPAVGPIEALPSFDRFLGDTRFGVRNDSGDECIIPAFFSVRAALNVTREVEWALLKNSGEEKSNERTG